MLSSRRSGSSSSSSGRREEIGRGGVLSETGKRDLVNPIVIDKSIDVQIRRPLTPHKVPVPGRSLPFDYQMTLGRAKSDGMDGTSGTGRTTAVVRKTAVKR